jgi:hypothetical protein
VSGAFLAIVLLARSRSTDPLEPVDQDPEPIRGAACDLTATDGVCNPDPPPPPRPPRNAPDLDWLGLFAWVLLAALLAGLLYLLVSAWMKHTGRGSLRGRRRAKRPESSEEVVVEEITTMIVDRSKEPTGWRADAERHRAAGDYKNAIRCRYRALVGDLARRGLIDEIPGRTTGEERMQLRVYATHVHAPFSASADLFDGAWFGDVAVHEMDDDTFQALEREVLAGTQSSRQPLPSAGGST